MKSKALEAIDIIFPQFPSHPPLFRLVYPLLCCIHPSALIRLLPSHSPWSRSRLRFHTQVSLFTSSCKISIDQSNKWGHQAVMEYSLSVVFFTDDNSPPMFEHDHKNARNDIAKDTAASRGLQPRNYSFIVRKAANCFLSTLILLCCAGFELFSVGSSFEVSYLLLRLRRRF